MAFEYLTNVPLTQAGQEYQALLLQNGFAPRVENIAVTEACGRYTAEAVYAHICAPHYMASAMDGIALRAKDTFGAGERTPVTLRPEQFTVVDTGDLVPEGCNAVVMIEDVIYQEDGTVRLYAPAVPWQHIRQIGEDICAGEMILPSYTQITPAAVGAMLASGVMRVSVLARPRVAIIPTGDEIIPPTEDPEPNSIMEFNSAIFSGLLKQWDAEPIVFPIVPDQYEQIMSAVEEAVNTCDIVILNAGSSAGREDYSAQVIRAVGSVLYHGIAMKPGKPAILGCCGMKPILGVPGYPVSGILVLETLLRPLVELWYHTRPAHSETVRATLSKTIVSGLKYQEFVRVRMGKVGEHLVATPLNRGSGIVTSFMKADGILEIPQGTEGYSAGIQVDIHLLRSADSLNHTLVATGSHDPLLDEAADFLHRSDPTLYMSSSHVGSMGGIMAIRRGEAHIAGVHLLDETDGSYNTAFIKKYFPNGGVYLVECVGRSQGLMVRAGNPLHITGIKDLCQNGLRYVNRQKGSGTRILIDYLCGVEGIDTRMIDGYDREEFTHTSVAAQIASGTADVGMGIYSAAKLYDLDFLPICTEQYDLLISDEAWALPQTQMLLNILKTEEFHQRLAAMGGYQVDQPGRVREHF